MREERGSPVGLDPTDGLAKARMHGGAAGERVDGHRRRGHLVAIADAEELIAIAQRHRADQVPLDPAEPLARVEIDRVDLRVAPAHRGARVQRFALAGHVGPEEPRSGVEAERGLEQRDRVDPESAAAVGEQLLEPRVDLVAIVDVGDAPHGLEHGVGQGPGYEQRHARNLGAGGRLDGAARSDCAPAPAGACPPRRGRSVESAGSTAPTGQRHRPPTALTAAAGRVSQLRHLVDDAGRGDRADRGGVVEWFDGAGGEAIATRAAIISPHGAKRCRQVVPMNTLPGAAPAALHPPRATASQ